MKKIWSIGLALALIASLAACGKTASPSSSAAPSSVAAPSTAQSSSVSESTPASSAPAQTDAPAAEELDAKVQALADAAGLGDSIKVMDIDLKAGNVNTDNIAAFAGKESKMSAQNGGIVIVLYAVDGTAETLAADMENFRQFRMGNGDYEEFEQARTNTENGRIKVMGNYVVYAVSATGDWDALDAAIDSQFA